MRDNTDQKPGADEPQAPRGEVVTDSMARDSRAQPIRQEDRSDRREIRDEPRKD